MRIFPRSSGTFRLHASLALVDEDPQPFVGFHNWILGNPQDYNRAYTTDLAQLRSVLAATQKHLIEAFDIAKRGVIDVLRKPDRWSRGCRATGGGHLTHKGRTDALHVCSGWRRILATRGDMIIRAVKKS
jgi:hypothetical protein